MPIDSIRIRDTVLHLNDPHTWTNRKTDIIDVFVHLTSTFPPRLMAYFEPLGKDTKVKKYIETMYYEETKYYKSILKSCSHHEALVPYVEKWMRKCSYRMDHITVSLKSHPFENSTMKELIQCRSAQLGVGNIESLRWWLEKLPEKMESIHITNQCERGDEVTIPSEYLNVPQIVQTSELVMSVRNCVTDELLLKFQARKLRIRNSVLISCNGINRYLKNWAKGLGVPNFKEIRIDEIGSTFDETTLIEGLNAENWESGFRQSNPKFCKSFSVDFLYEVYYQIESFVDPYESVTLAIGKKTVTIAKTGTKATQNGRDITIYEYSF
ncbi:hypothetical protein CAEBREN_14665 [Caenorhabditis brenneri]|uniref:Sdz-33 F-box domain-containing protein n=1 Tax=Caenorhabditis brenneri TaxID=135651 RepID=G0MZI8_CAEBE|nr:hypothetical protein CAEBREN_14665 [Caenorhabditis brenneri]